MRRWKCLSRTSGSWRRKMLTHLPWTRACRLRFVEATGLSRWVSWEEKGEAEWQTMELFIHSCLLTLKSGIRLQGLMHSGMCSFSFHLLSFIFSCHVAGITYIGLQNICNQRLMVFANISASLWHGTPCKSHLLLHWVQSRRPHSCLILLGAFKFSLKTSALPPWFGNHDCTSQKWPWSYFKLLTISSLEQYFLPFPQGSTLLFMANEGACGLEPK